MQKSIVHTHLMNFPTFSSCHYQKGANNHKLCYQGKSLGVVLTFNLVINQDNKVSF